MKHLLLASMLLAAGAASAQDEDPTVTAERARLKSEREKVEAVFKAEEKACYGKFAVNDCLAAAKARRRTAVSDLRRQEVALNDAQRKRKAAERRSELDGKSTQQREREASAPVRGASQVERGVRAEERSATRSAQAASASARAAQHERELRQRAADHASAKQRRDDEAAKNAREHQERLAAAKERADRLRKRDAERKKPAASGLQDPK